MICTPSFSLTFHIRTVWCCLSIHGVSILPLLSLSLDLPPPLPPLPPSFSPDAAGWLFSRISFLKVHHLHHLHLHPHLLLIYISYPSYAAPPIPASTVSVTHTSSFHVPPPAQPGPVQPSPAQQHRCQVNSRQCCWLVVGWTGGGSG